MCIRDRSDVYCSMASTVGDLCMAECKMENGQTVVIVAVYISLNKTLDDIIDFLRRSLLSYTSQGAPILRKDIHKIPTILSGDFNVNFALDKSIELVEFLKDNLNLSIQNDKKISTTKSNTTIDAVFTRFLDNISVKHTFL